MIPNVKQIAYSDMHTDYPVIFDDEISLELLDQLYPFTTVETEIPQFEMSEQDYKEYLFTLNHC